MKRLSHRGITLTKLDRILEENSDVWKNKSAFMNYIRGGLRKSLWSRHPVKLKLIKEKRKRIINPKPTKAHPTVWGAECSICNKDFPQKDIQVDHIREDYNQLNEIEDIQQFVEGLSLVTMRDLRLVCKPCHAIVSYSQKQGISFEDAKVAKEIIALSKDDKLMLDKIVSFGVELADIPKTKKGRKELVTKLMES